jgi:hypothetical protein
MASDKWRVNPLKYKDGRTWSPGEVRRGSIAQN